jgi:hypothetical protein
LPGNTNIVALAVITQIIRRNNGAEQMHQLFYKQNQKAIDNVNLTEIESKNIDKEVGKVLMKMNSDLEKIALREFEKNESQLKTQ